MDIAISYNLYYGYDLPLPVHPIPTTQTERSFTIHGFSTYYKRERTTSHCWRFPYSGIDRTVYCCLCIAIGAAFTSRARAVESGRTRIWRDDLS